MAFARAEYEGPGPGRTQTSIELFFVLIYKALRPSLPNTPTAYVYNPQSGWLVPSINHWGRRKHRFDFLRHPPYNSMANSHLKLILWTRRDFRRLVPSRAPRCGYCYPHPGCHSSGENTNLVLCVTRPANPLTNSYLNLILRTRHEFPAPFSIPCSALRLRQPAPRKPFQRRKHEFNSLRHPLLTQ